MGKPKTSRCGGSSGDSRILITDIRDREDNAVPRPAMNSIVKQILEAVTNLGLKATVQTNREKGEISQH
jgi:hypothetical protein